MTQPVGIEIIAEEVENLKKEIGKLKIDKGFNGLLPMQRQIQDMGKEISRLQDELQHLKGKKDLNMSPIIAEIASLKNETDYKIGNMQKMIKPLVEKGSKADEKNKPDKEMEKTLEKMDALEKQMRDLTEIVEVGKKSQSDEMSGELGSKIEEIEKIGEDIEFSREKVEKMEKELSFLMNDIEELKKSRGAVEPEEIEDLRSKVTGMYNSIEEINTKMNNFEENATKSTEDAKSLMDEKISQIDFGSLKTSLEELAGRISEIESRLGVIEEKLTELGSARETLVLE